MDPDRSLEGSKLPELKIDARQAQGFISFFKKLPQDSRAVRFFDRKDYYTAHGDNSTFIARTYYHTTTALRQLGNGHDALSSVTVSKNMFETILRDLLLERSDHTVQLYEGTGSNWRLTKTGTPGNTGSFEEILFANNEMQDSPVIVSLNPIIRENQCNVGLCFLDMTRKKLGITEFLDDNQFTNVESVLISLGCKECIVPMESVKIVELKPLCEAISRCNVLVTEKKKSEFRSRDLVQDLGRIIRGSIEPVRDLISNFDLALGALGALISYTELLTDDSNYGNYSIENYNLDKYMRLDSAAVCALNVFESKTDLNKNFSLFGLLNRTCTAGMGKRLLNRWLKQPLLDVNEINCRMDLVQAFNEDPEMRHGLRLHLRRISDIERLTRVVQKKTNSLQPVIKLYQSAIRLPHIKDILENHKGQFSSLIKTKYLKPLQHWMQEDRLGTFIALVEIAIDLDQIENGEYMISPSYASDLANLKKQLDEIEEQITKIHKQTATDLDLQVDKTLKLEKGTQFGHVFRITKKEEQKVRKKLSSQYVVLETRKDGVKFTNGKLKKLGDEFQRVLSEYSSCQKEIVARVVETSASFSEVFEAIAGMLSELDVLLSFADVASSCPIPYVRPDITSSDEGDIILEGSRHPCLEAQDGVNFIANDCTLVRGKSWFQIITGPNMGGKSTFIRQVGVNVLMAQVGCFLPCDRASVSIRDCIFARVGAGDCQLRGVSTFMQEMLETASILKGASDKSLIIIDELGRGTSTYDGFGLAWAICEHLVEVIRAPTLFATHFHELTALAQKSSLGVANYHVKAHIDPSNRKLTMLFKVEAGACDQSFGIHVAEFANFPEEVVKLAKSKAEELEDFSTAPVLCNDSNEAGACDQSFGIHVAEFANFPEEVVKLAKSKAEELEDFSTAPVLCNDSNEQVGGKRKREFGSDELTDGATRAHLFLEQFSALPLDQMDLNQALDHVAKLRSDLEKDAAKNPWLLQFF